MKNLIENIKNLFCVGAFFAAVIGYALLLKLLRYDDPCVDDEGEQME